MPESFQTTENSETTSSTETPSDQKVEKGVRTVRGLRPQRDMETATFTHEDGTTEQVSRRKGFGGAWRTEGTNGKPGRIIGNQDSRVTQDTAENTTAARQINKAPTKAPTEAIPQPETGAENRSGAPQQSRSTPSRDMETATFTHEDGTTEQVSRRKGFGGAWRTEGTNGKPGRTIGNQDSRVTQDTAENTTPSQPLNTNRTETETPTPNTNAATQTPQSAPTEEPTLADSGFKGVKRPPQPAERVIPRVGMDGRRLN